MNAGVVAQPSLVSRIVWSQLVRGSAFIVMGCLPLQHAAGMAERSYYRVGATSWAIAALATVVLLAAGARIIQRDALRPVDGSLVAPVRMLSVIQELIISGGGGGIFYLFAVLFPLSMSADPRTGLADAAIAVPMALVASLMPAWRPTYEVTPEGVFRHRFGRASFVKTRVAGPVRVEAVPHHDRAGNFTGMMMTLTIGAKGKTAELEKLSPITPPELVEQVRQAWAFRVWQAQGAPRG